MGRSVIVVYLSIIKRETDMGYSSIVFNNRKIAIDKSLLETFEEYYGTELPNWRIENYIRQRVFDAETDLDILLKSLSDAELSKIVMLGIRNEISAKDGFDDTASCMIENPHIDKRKY